MTKKRGRQSTRRQAKKLEIARIQAGILTALSRDIHQFLEEQRQLTDRTAVLKCRLRTAKHTQQAAKFWDSGIATYELEKARKSLLGSAKP